MPRKSAAAKAIQAIASAASPLAPPADLLSGEVIIWNETVGTWPADDLRGLADFCRHTALARRLGEEADMHSVSGDPAERRRLLRDRAREQKQAATIERSARATRRVRRDAPKVAAIYALRPWQGWGDAELDKCGPPLPAGYYKDGQPGAPWWHMLGKTQSEILAEQSKPQ
jgi:hypothetical protein